MAALILRFWDVHAATQKRSRGWPAGAGRLCNLPVPHGERNGNSEGGHSTQEGAIHRQKEGRAIVGDVWPRGTISGTYIGKQQTCLLISQKFSQKSFKYTIYTYIYNTKWISSKTYHLDQNKYRSFVQMFWHWFQFTECFLKNRNKNFWYVFFTEFDILKKTYFNSNYFFKN